MQLHASCVAVDGQAALIRGRAGSGKSSLALQLIALGAALVADDRTRLTSRDGIPVARAPDRLQGCIEARGVGILTVPWLASAPVRLVVDMDRTETDRLPQDRHARLLDTDLPLFHKVESPHFAAAVLLYLRGGKATL